MPESKPRRKKKTESQVQSQNTHAVEKPMPNWYKPVMFGLMLLGLLWIIVYYVSQTVYPIPDIGGWNIIIGFGIAMIGFFMTTGWK